MLGKFVGLERKTVSLAFMFSGPLVVAAIKWAVNISWSKIIAGRLVVYHLFDSIPPKCRRDQSLRLEDSLEIPVELPEKPLPAALTVLKAWSLQMEHLRRIHLPSICGQHSAAYLRKRYEKLRNSSLLCSPSCLPVL